MPQLADTKSPLEDRFLFPCERYAIPLPEVNFEIAGYEVDAVWPEHRFRINRYGSEQIDHTHAATAADLKRELGLPRDTLPSGYTSELNGNSSVSAST